MLTSHSQNALYMSKTIIFAFQIIRIYLRWLNFRKAWQPPKKTPKRWVFSYYNYHGPGAMCPLTWLKSDTACCKWAKRRKCTHTNATQSHGYLMLYGLALQDCAGLMITMTLKIYIHDNNFAKMTTIFTILTKICGVAFTTNNKNKNIIIYVCFRYRSSDTSL